MGEAQLVVYSLINRLQLFLTSFFRVFFSQFLISLYYLSSLGLQLLIYFLLARYWLAIRSIYYIDYIYCAQGPSFKARQYSSSLFLITAQILSSLQLISLRVANKPYLFSTRGRQKRTLYLYVVMATNLGLRSSDLELTQRRRTAVRQDLVVVMSVGAVVKSFHMGQ